MIEDDPEEARTIRAMLNDRRESAFALTPVASLTDAEAYFAEHFVDIVLLDLGLFELYGPEAVGWARRRAPEASFVLLARQDDEPKAIQALREGAQDCLLKEQMEPLRLMGFLEHAMERRLARGHGGPPGAHTSSAGASPQIKICARRAAETEARQKCSQR